MPVQKEPYRYMMQLSSEGLSPMSRLATAARGGFAPDENQQNDNQWQTSKIGIYSQSEYNSAWIAHDEFMDPRIRQEI